MPANLTPDYLGAEREYKSAVTQAEKVAALERMLATLPKHKGTEKMQADIRRRLSQTRKEAQKKGAHHATPFYLVEKEGAGQVALIGPPNSGKSQLVCSLTHAAPEVADYPFTTRMPTPGMMMFEDVQIQLLDLPPLSGEFMEQWLPLAIRAAHLSVLVVDINDLALLDELDFILGVIEARRLAPPGLVLCNKVDLPGAADNFTALEDLYRGRFPMLAASAATGEGLDRFRRAVFDALGIVRVYTKVPGRKFEFGTPYILKRGKTVADAAAHVHKDFALQLKFARLFRLTADRDGLMVERSHVVQDRDILEFHI
jgi:ribosome-interacting GTPase 1